MTPPASHLIEERKFEAGGLNYSQLDAALPMRHFRFCRCQYHHMHHASRAQTSQGAKTITAPASPRPRREALDEVRSPAGRTPPPRAVPPWLRNQRNRIQGETVIADRTLGSCTAARPSEIQQRG